MAVSIKEIAKICGVSEGTVDRALNNRSGIKAETKERILAVAAKHNYKPNHMARCLATGKTKTIGVVCINTRDNFFSYLLEAIEAAAKKAGYFITLILSHNKIEEEIDGIRYLINRGVDGLILFPVARGDEYVKVLKELNVPIVTIYNRISGEFPHIDVNSMEIMKNAVKMIHNKGYNKIAYLDVNFDKARDSGINIYSFEQRRLGYETGISELGLENYVIEGFRRETIKEFIDSKTDSENEVANTDNPDDSIECKCNSKSAILCSYDNLAIKVLSMCREEGYVVPRDIGLMGFNNLQILDDIYPRLYSVDCNIKMIGSEAFETLNRMMNGGEKENDDVVIDYFFSEGTSL